MTEERKVVETNLTRPEAYKKCFKRATQLGLTIKANVMGERLEIEKGKRTVLWWLAVIFGFALYIFPGVLVLVFWKPVDYCRLFFEDSPEGTVVVAQVKGEAGTQFFNDISGVLA